MRIQDLKHEYKEALCMFESLRRLGFQPKDITFAFAKSPIDQKVHLAVVANYRGKTFTADIAPITLDAEAAEQELIASIEAWKTSDEVEATAIYFQSVVFSKNIPLVMALKEKDMLPFKDTQKN